MTWAAVIVGFVVLAVWLDRHDARRDRQARADRDADARRARQYRIIRELERHDHDQD